MTVTTTDGDGDIATDSQAVGNLISFEDDGPTAGTDSLHIENTVFDHLNIPFTTVTMSQDVPATFVWDMDNMPDDFTGGPTHGGDPIEFMLADPAEPGGILIGYVKIDGTLFDPDDSTTYTALFEVTIDMPTDTGNPTYNFNLLEGPIGTPGVFESYTDHTGGNDDFMTLQWDTTITSILTGSAPDGKNTVNASNDWIGVGTGPVINEGEIMSIRFEGTGDVRSAEIKMQSFKGDSTLDWAVLWYTGTGVITDLTNSETTPYSAGEFSSTGKGDFDIQIIDMPNAPPIGGSPDGFYHIVLIGDGDPSTDDQSQIELVRLYGGENFNDLNFDLPYTLIDADDDTADDGVISVHLDSDDTLVTSDGNDTISLDAVDNPVDGGGGFDTLLVSDINPVQGTPITLDFSNITDMEALHLNATESQEVTLNLNEVLNMVGDGNTLMVSGGAGDIVNFNDGNLVDPTAQWTSSAPDSYGNITFSEVGTTNTVIISPVDDANNQVTIDLDIDI